jgi:hypothetical protein
MTATARVISDVILPGPNMKLREQTRVACWFQQTMSRCNAGLDVDPDCIGSASNFASIINVAINTCSFCTLLNSLTNQSPGSLLLSTPVDDLKRLMKRDMPHAVAL